MATYATAGSDVMDALLAVVKNHHPHFAEHGVSFTVLYAHAPVNEQTGEPKGRPLKVGGGPVDVKVKPVGLKDRVAGANDCEILLDGDAGKDWSAEELAARLDHALYQLELQTDEDGRAVTDDCGRPKLRRRPFDFAAFGFRDVAARYGDAAPETRAVRQVARLMDELTADWSAARPAAANGAA